MATAALRRVKPGDPLCEVETDSGPLVIFAETQEPGWLIAQYVPAGQEVPPSGVIGEWSTNGSRPLSVSQWPMNSSPKVNHRDVEVMLSYRRTDSELYAGRLHEWLVREFGGDKVFMDVFTIQPGEHWAAAVQSAAATCRAMIVLIGPTWEHVTDDWGKRRISSKYDPVHREVVAALDRHVWLFPVLVGREHIPERSVLPREMHHMFDFQALHLGTRTWTSDARLLLDSIAKSLGTAVTK